MDALEFLQARQRMCDTYYNSEDETCSALCPATGIQCVDMNYIHENGHEKELLARVEAWSKEHPRKTRQSVLLEQYPTAQIDKDGCLDICPSTLFDTYRNKYGGCTNYDVGCPECRKDFWLKEVN